MALLPGTTPETESDDGSSKYALFPFVQQYELPWTSASGDLFRARRLNHWLGNEADDPSALSSNGTGAKGIIINMNG